ncbi:MAG: GNAT family N-acetyltransferase [Firmicutes bacterium]|nr:GNAT family N-acetyltransferase [Bacillota bacterium]
MPSIKGENIELKLIRPQRCRVLFAICLRGNPIGEIELDQIAWRSGEAELKISIPEGKFQNRGYGTAAVTALLDHAFNTMALNRVYLRVHAVNYGAIRCYQKAGFRKEWHLERTIENKKEKIYLMGIERRKFLENKGAEKRAV